MEPSVAPVTEEELVGGLPGAALLAPDGIEDGRGEAGAGGRIGPPPERGLRGHEREREDGRREGKRGDR